MKTFLTIACTHIKIQQHPRFVSFRKTRRPWGRVFSKLFNMTSGVWRSLGFTGKLESEVGDRGQGIGRSRIVASHAGILRGTRILYPPHLHKRLLNWEQHSFSIVFLFLEPSEAMRARGIIVLVKSNHNVIAQKYRDKTTLASKTRFSRHCFVFQSRRYSLLVGYNIQPSISSTNQTQHG